jgi:CDP-glucose 4,6-dehydratase
MIDWTGRRVLVTGGAGFCGSHLGTELATLGAAVTVLDRALPADSYLRQTGAHERVEFVTGDILDAEAMGTLVRDGAFETIFHLAAQPIVSISNARPAETAAVNIMGTYSLLEAARAASSPPDFVFASSGAYYGATNTTAAIPEDAPPLVAANIYAPSKAAADLAVRCYARVYGLNTVACRWMNTYGPGDTNYTRIVPATLRRLKRGEPALIDGTDGTNVLEILHVRDMVAAYLAVAAHIKEPEVRGEAFNFGGGTPLTLREVVMTIVRAWNQVTGQDIDEEPVATGPHVPSVKYLDVSKARARLGWGPRIPLLEGLRETVRWHLTFTGEGD